MKKRLEELLHENVRHVARLHFVFVGLLIVQIIIYDAWKLLTPESVLQRWLAVTGLLIVTIIVWYIARTGSKSSAVSKILVGTLVCADIAIASFSVYAQRGMAARAVLLFIIPIIVSAVLLSRTAVFATAALSAAVYSLTAVAYFVLNFNEGYKIELYGEVSFYCATFFIAAALLSVFIRNLRQRL